MLRHFLSGNRPLLQGDTVSKQMEVRDGQTDPIGLSSALLVHDKIKTRQPRHHLSREHVPSPTVT